MPEPSTPPPPAAYTAFLLRLYELRDAERPAWVASLQGLNTDERHWFASIEALAKFLQGEFGEAGAAEAGEAKP